MFSLLKIIAFSSLCLLSYAGGIDDCSLLSSKYFQWLDSDGSLIWPEFEGISVKKEYNDNCCGKNCNKPWKTLANSSNCQFCASNNVLVCQGPGKFEVPHPNILPTTSLSLYKISDFESVAFTKQCFTGLDIQRLQVERSNLTIRTGSFDGVKSIQVVDFRNNTLQYLCQVRFVFDNIPNMVVLNLENNGLKRIYFASPSNESTIQLLKYVGFAGNDVQSMDLSFLQNSSLQFINFRGISFKIKTSKIKDIGLSSLPDTLHTIDFNQAKISVRAIARILQLLNAKNITTLNLSYLESSSHLLSALLPISDTLQYLSLEGTNMMNAFSSKSREKNHLRLKKFTKLKELNLKNCQIEELEGDIFKAFPNVKTLSLAENDFFTLDLNVFLNIPSLNFVDLRSNRMQDISGQKTMDNASSNVLVMDLSFAHFDLGSYMSSILFQVMSHLQMISLCSATVDEYVIKALQPLKQLKVLDVSNTLTGDPSLVFAYQDLFSKSKAPLEELYFAKNSFKFSEGYSSIFLPLTSLKTLDLSNNIFREFSPYMMGPALENLKLSQNLITTWYSSAILTGRKLKTLDLSTNQITYIIDPMLHDFYKLISMDLTNNPLICHKKVVAMVCDNYKNKTHNVTMINWQKYWCYDLLSNDNRSFSEPEACDEYYEEGYATPIGMEKAKDSVPLTFNPLFGDLSNSTVNFVSISPMHHSTTTSIYPMPNPENLLEKFSKSKLIIVGLIIVLNIVGIVVYTKWWAIRCNVHRYFALRRARLLRKENEALTKPEMQYDVFVSYSDVDRSWILDHLIPNMEADGDISICFHERDFQIGLSILENIIECMDRSHSLLLVVSKAFVRSKWCQFEVHLAQYRLIETIRDQLVLVLLEDIPRKSRPQVLHHLMMTKTYLVWPQLPCKEEATQLFWKRLKRALKPNNNLIVSF